MQDSMKTISWIVAGAGLVVLGVGLVRQMSNVTPPPAADHNAPIADAGPPPPDAAPDDPDAGPAAEQPLTEVERMAEKGQQAFSRGEYTLCATLFRAVLQQSKEHPYSQGLFHCEYAARSLDFTEGPLSKKDREELSAIVEEGDKHIGMFVEAISSAIMWMMVQDRRRCADSLALMEKLMLKDPDMFKVMSDTEKAQLRTETQQLMDFVLDTANSFEAIRDRMGKVLGIE